MKKSFLVAFFTLGVSLAAHAQVGFEVVIIGARGGILDGNLSAFMIRPAGDTKSIMCDAGSLVSGIKAADERDVFDYREASSDSKMTRIGDVLTQDIKGYLISHAHLDHVAGLITASPDDSKKPIYALASVNKELVDNYFNWEAWPNFTDRGVRPLKQYHLDDLVPGRKIQLENTQMFVTAYPLSHGGVESTVFLLESGSDAMLCFGDTGGDGLEKSNDLQKVWEQIAPLVKEGRLKGMIIESSFSDSQPDKFMFGHLRPSLLMSELRALENLAGKGKLSDLPVVISHIKYSLKSGSTPLEIIEGQLNAQNDVGVKFIIPQQGDSIFFR